MTRIARPLLRGIAALLLALPLAASPEEPAVEVYRPARRPPAELAEVANDLLGGRGRAVVDRAAGAVVLRGEAPALGEAIEALRELDVQPATYRVHSTLTSLREVEAAGISIRAWRRSADVRVAALDGPTAGATLRAHAGRSREGRRFEGTVAVLDGRAAEIWTGTTYPARLHSLEETPYGRVWRETAALVAVRTGLRVRPRALGDGSIELEIEPIIEDGNPEDRIVRAGAATTLRVRPGQPVLAASASDRTRRTAFDPFAGLEHREDAHDTALLIEIEPLPPNP
jgi:hypothetical protein